LNTSQGEVVPEVSGIEKKPGSAKHPGKRRRLQIKFPEKAGEKSL